MSGLRWSRCKTCGKMRTKEARIMYRLRDVEIPTGGVRIVCVDRWGIPTAEVIIPAGQAMFQIPEEWREP